MTARAGTASPEPSREMTQELIERLEPCPFCGSEKVHLSDNDRGLMFNVHCEECCARGPWERCAADGIAAWNTRDQSQSARIAELAEKNDKLAKWLYEACGGFPVSEEAFAAIAPDLPVVAHEMSRPFKGRSLAEFRAEIEEKIAALTKDSTSG